ncbi:DUF4440 domain-containing protein [Deminuibacter soli]|nr:nuclear transport factor 2 family protein [Deminuibacter soli]
MSQYLLQKNINGLKTLFAAGAIVMPEYHPAIYSNESIFNYYQSWFDSTTTRLYQKHTLDVQRSGNYYIETGAFTWQFSKQNNTTTYTGKYLTVWERTDTLFQIAGTAWGADRPIAPNTFLFSRKDLADPVPVPPASQLTTALAQRNEGITTLVKNRQGQQHALQYFTNDAMYLTYDSPVFSGIKDICNYFSEHEKPGDVMVDSLKISASKIIDAGTLKIEFGYYTIDVRWQGGGGRFTGKSINIWRKEEDGSYKLFRQMVNHT